MTTGNEAPTIGQANTPPEYLQAEYIGGIPASILAQRGKGSTRTASGRNMFYDVQADSLHFASYSNNGEEVSFSAGTVTETLPSGASEPCITLDVRTRLSDGSYHPDFRADALFHAAVSYLNQGQPVAHIMGKWNDEGDNTAQYHANLSSFGDNPTHQQQLAAANGTWTGRMANANGYYAEAVSTNGYNYQVLFTRDAPNYPLLSDSTDGQI